MSGSITARHIQADAQPADIFEAIGAFLRAQGLGPDPRHYAFGFAVLSNPGSPLFGEVHRITDGGVRLSSGDIARLGGEVGALGGEPLAAEPGDDARAAALIARSEQQVAGFARLVGTIEAETKDFGHSLARSADAIRHAADSFGVDEVVRLTGAMLDRIRASEVRLESARVEAEGLRAELSEARDNARRDALTGLLNRRGLEEAFAEQAAAGHAMVIAVCDVDHFKRVNDQFGHAVGDRVLKVVGAEIAGACEPHLVARLGGEEFVVLFENGDVTAAHAVVDAARETVASKRYRVRGTDEPLGAITFSAGVSPVVPNESFEDAFVRADRLLYAAKQAGRNRVAL